MIHVYGHQSKGEQAKKAVRIVSTDKPSKLFFIAPFQKPLIIVLKFDN